jgi:DNA replicative helicase MCM subunit Mcm2 (Cdc46/Mcm family)
MKQPDWQFQCKKCRHYLFVDKKEMNKMRDTEECPDCGEETPIFVFVGEGNFEDWNLNL